MTSGPGARIAVTMLAVAIVGASLTGCGPRTGASRQSPSAGVAAQTSTPTPSTASDGASVRSIQDDLNSADSATTNAGGDLSDAASSAATDDSP